VNHPPSVDRLARSLADTGLPHPVLVAAARAAIAAGSPGDARREAERWSRSLLRPVLNATGVLLHTNLGRAPVAHAQASMATNLELDLDSGQRGSRQRAVTRLVGLATGSEAALAVNNCAGALLLSLAAVAASGQPVAVSRGELVEIGGGFRVPDVMAQSGARLVEVGTTNRTRRSDYERAVAAGAVAVLKVHQSNYRIEGFTEEVPIAGLSGLGVPVLADLGSGLLDEACPWLSDGPPPWLAGEPAARQSLRHGADLVVFSGDKLLGGPQAGILAGRADLVEACARHPLARALRPGGLVLAALQDTLLAYLRRDGEAIAFWRQATIPVDELARRAERIVADAGRGESRPSEAVPGGGTLPGRRIPSRAVVVPGDRLEALRDRERPVIARVADGETWLDLRAVEPDDDAELVAALGTLG
jgi:L-seryl-tRNA(Ser) seleniumtransferase